MMQHLQHTTTRHRHHPGGRRRAVLAAPPGRVLRRQRSASAACAAAGQPHGFAARASSVAAKASPAASAEQQQRAFAARSSVAAKASSAAATEQHQQQANAAAQAGAKFDWLRAWYPVAIVSQLEEDKPTPTLLLGRNLVLWRNYKTQQWCALEDRCPHRLAPLSEGRLDPSSGDLMCSYHGWQFDSTGRCTRIPQIAEPAAHATACASKRTCAISYPCQVAQGLLWVWADPGSPETAAATSPALTEQWGSPDWTLLGGEWFARDVEYGFDTLLENLLDPSHIPFAHHKIMGAATRDKAQPLEVKTAVDVTAAGFQLTRDTAPFKTPDRTDTVNSWTPPCLNSSVQTNERTGRSLVLTFYGVPVAPGKSRVITAFFTNGKVPALAQKLGRVFEWVFHLGQNQVLDSDAMLLHIQERQLHLGVDPNWRTAFYLPASADTGIVKFRQWFTDCAGGDIPWPGGARGTDLGPVLPRQQVLDRLHQHVEGCKSCRVALRWVQRLQVAALALAGAAAAVAIATVTAAATTAAAAGSSTSSGVAALLAAVPAWQTGVAGVLVVAMLLAHTALGQLRQRFIFKDYEHWAIP